MSQPESKFARVRGIQLHYVDWGDNGPPLVMLHGDLRTGRSWDAVARGLRDDFRVISLDARGHGDSDWPARGYHSKDRVADLSAFCRELGLSGVIGVGHSMGAIAMAQFAGQSPEIFSRLVLLEPRVVVDETFHRRVSARFGQPKRTWPSREALHEYLKGHAVTGRWRDDVLRDVVEHEALERADGSLDMKWTPDMFNPDDRVGDHYDLKDIFRGFRMPVLLVGGGEGSDNLDGVGPVIAAVPTMSMVTIRNTGHNMYMERPDAVVQAIRGFVSGEELPAEL